MKRIFYILLVFSFSPYLLSGCSGIANYAQNRTVDLPSGRTSYKAPLPRGTYAAGPFEREPFKFTDARPLVLVIGHVEIRRNGKRVNDTGALEFGAREFKTNKSFVMTPSEVITVVSGEWFAGRIFAGRRKLDTVHISEGPYAHQSCDTGTVFKQEPFFWDKQLLLRDPKKVYYLGHIVLDEQVGLFLKRFVKMTVRDLRSEHSEKLRTLVGERDVEPALLLSCPD